MVQRLVVTYCEDCPFERKYCHPDSGYDCNAARWFKKQLDDAPPLTRETLVRIARLLRG